MYREMMDRLKQASSEEVSPYIPELLNALKDDEYKKTVFEILIHYPTESTILIEEALLSDDLILKKILLQQLVPVLPFYSKILVANAVEHNALVPGSAAKL